MRGAFPEMRGRMMASNYIIYIFNISDAASALLNIEVGLYVSERTFRDN